MKFELFSFKSFFLKEQQILDFDRQEFVDGIKSFIEWAKSTPKDDLIPNRYLHTFYRLITNSYGSVGTAKNLGFKDEEIKNWRSYFNSNPWYGDGPWSQVSFNFGPKEKKKGVTHCFYVTLEKTKDNILKFQKALGNLIETMKNFSINKKAYTAFKTHKYLDMFVGYNDSVKFYFYEESLKEEYIKTIREWFIKNQITVTPRTHEYGIDKEEVNSTGEKTSKSYGEVISKEVANTIANFIRTPSNKQYTAEVWVKWIKTHLADMIKKAKIQA